jgi:hypothetical protein
MDTRPASKDSFQHVPVLDFDRIGPRVGARFPDVVLADQHGQAVDLHKSRAGHKGLVVFYRGASW